MAISDNVQKALEKSGINHIPDQKPIADFSEVIGQPLPEPVTIHHNQPTELPDHQAERQARHHPDALVPARQQQLAALNPEPVLHAEDQHQQHQEAAANIEGLFANTDAPVAAEASVTPTVAPDNRPRLNIVGQEQVNLQVQQQPTQIEAPVVEQATAMEAGQAELFLPPSQQSAQTEEAAPSLAPAQVAQIEATPATTVGAGEMQPSAPKVEVVDEELTESDTQFAKNIVDFRQALIKHQEQQEQKAA